MPPTDNIQETYIEVEVEGTPGFMGRFRHGFMEALDAQGKPVEGWDLHCDLLQAVCPWVILDGVFGTDGRFWVSDCIERAIWVVGGQAPPLWERKAQVEQVVSRLNAAGTPGPGYEVPFDSVPCMTPVDEDEAEMMVSTLAEGGSPAVTVAHTQAPYCYPTWRSG